jgi:hypothetical protein
MPEHRTALQQNVVEALVNSKAINLDLVGATLGKFGETALLRGESIVTIINRHAFWACGWPGPDIEIARGPIARQQVE